MKSIGSFIKWCYERWGQAFSFLMALYLTNLFTDDMYRSPDLGGTFLIGAWLATGLVLRHQMLRGK